MEWVQPMRGDLPYPEGSRGGPQPQIERPVGKRRARSILEDASLALDPESDAISSPPLPIENRDDDGSPKPKVGLPKGQTLVRPATTERPARFSEKHVSLRLANLPSEVSSSHSSQLP